jgi:hypothetical protein
MEPCDVLHLGAELVTGDRATTHGDYKKSYAMVADLWASYTGAKISSQDVLIMMSLMKIARMKHGTHNADDFVDGAAYLAMAESL